MIGEPIKPMTTKAAEGGIPGPKMLTEKMMKTTDLSCYPIGRVPKGSPVKITNLPKMSSKRR